MAELAAAQQELQTLVTESTMLADRLRVVRAQESVVRGKVQQLEQQQRHSLQFDVESKVKNLSCEIQEKEQAMRELQAAYERMQEEKARAQAELERVNKIKSDNHAPQTTININNSRYELTAPKTMTNSSNDPLSQSSVPLVNSFRATNPRPASAASIDMIGQGFVSASPRVDPTDYLAPKDRPFTPSAKFAEFRSPNRSSTKIHQPPGGASSMNQIFG